MSAKSSIDIDDILAKLAAAPKASDTGEQAQFPLHNIVDRAGGIDFTDRTLAASHPIRDLV